MVHRNVIMILEPSVEASYYVAGESCACSQGRDTSTIGIINNSSVWAISLPENYSQNGRSTGKSNNSGLGTTRITSRDD